MTHILFIKNGEGIPENLREVITSPQIRCVSRRSPKEATSALERNAFNLAIIYADGSDSTLAKHLRALRELNKELPTIIISPVYSIETEQLAFDEGADLYFSEPLPKQSLERLIQQHAGKLEHGYAATSGQHHPHAHVDTTGSPVPALQILRDFSHVLGFSLDYKAFTHHFILKLRDHISFSRIGIFLENDVKKPFARGNQSHTLSCIASFGLPTDLTECYQLSHETGIGRTLSEQPRILRANSGSRSPFGDSDPTVQKELAILGCQLAIPISDRERPIGVAVLSGPVTGREYSEDELQLLYLLMEELGIAIKNSRLHSELAAHGKLIGNVLQSMSSGALVLSEDLTILYSNDSTKKFLGVHASDQEAIEWADLPNQLATPIHRAVEKGELPEPFLISGLNPDELYRISIIPFSEGEELALLPRPVMVIIEDFTKIEASKQNALEDSKSQLISLIAKRFAHEIRNSLVPLTTHMQLIDKKIDQPNFQTSLKSALKRETGRIKRFSEQMLYLAQNSNLAEERVDIESAIFESFRKATEQSGMNQIKLDLDNTLKDASVVGNLEGIAYAFEELFLNSVQAQGASEEPIKVTIRRNDEGILTIMMRDGGPGFDPETVNKVSEPFYSSRNTGVGLGLSVAKKIIEEHNGFISPNIRTSKSDWDIQIELPSTLAHPINH